MRRPRIVVTVEGPQGSGKTRVFDTLRAAGWDVSEEKSDFSRANHVVQATVKMPVRRKSA